MIEEKNNNLIRIPVFLILLVLLLLGLVQVVMRRLAVRAAGRAALGLLGLVARARLFVGDAALFRRRRFLNVFITLTKFLRLEL